MAKVMRHELAKIIANKTLQRGQSDKRLAESIAAYLLEESRYGELDSLLRDVQKAWIKMGYVDVLAKVARPLPDSVYADLLKPFKMRYPKANTVNLTPVIEPSIIGGASLELAEQRMDMSIGRRLRRFKKSINAKEMV